MAKDNTERMKYAGPKHPDFGFPLWYEDATGTRLGLGIPADQFTPAIGAMQHPGAPLVFPTNFPEEAFYFYADSRMDIGGAGTVGRARLVLALEAAFGGVGKPDPQLRTVFARIRVDLRDVVPGAQYVVTHPYGITEKLTADGRGRVFVTEDRGIGEDRFDGVLANGRVAPFLTWATGAPPGYVGDGVSPRRVTGSPFGTNLFRVDGPRVAMGGGPRDPAEPDNIDRIQTELFTVQGRHPGPLGAELNAHYDREPGGRIIVNLHAPRRRTSNWRPHRVGRASSWPPADATTPRG